MEDFEFEQDLQDEIIISNEFAFTEDDKFYVDGEETPIHQLLVGQIFTYGNEKTLWKVSHEIFSHVKGNPLAILATEVYRWRDAAVSEVPLPMPSYRGCPDSQTE